MRKITFLALLASGLPIFGWGPEGHSLVARIAFSELTPAAKTRVAAILAPGQTLASIASWADEVRRSRQETGPWHYVDIPIHKAHLDMARDCAKGDCVVAAIARMRQTLKDPAASETQQREALMFLVHFIGDMHQPLHCSDNEDKGGNSVKVAFGERQTNLHSLWDSGMLGRMGPEEQLFATLSAQAARNRKKWSKGTVEDWAEQSHKMAQKVVYGKLPKGPAGATIKVGADYQKVADPLIEVQIEKAGVRLAAVLNATFR